ncbi:MAG: TRAP transporter substrate-binding protein [Rhodovibrionaceae bacterium]|nr:TRAP transporter substrate-binding protein [Rhodovibrionaceae bacterium]
MKKLFAALATGLMAALSATAVSAETWNMPTPYPDQNFHTVNIQKFADDVAAATDGELQITVHPAGSLIKHPEIENAVRGGQVPIGEFLLSRLSNENAIFNVDSVPFLATSYEQAEKLWIASRPKIADLLAEQNLRILFAVPWPPQGLYTKEAVESLDDLKGVKFRAYNAATERLAELAGMVPTQIEVPDIAQAFATGRVDAMMTSPSTGVNSKAWDFVNHYYDTRAWLPKNIVVVNEGRFEALPDNVREAVLTAAAKAEDRGWKASMEETKTQTDVLRDEAGIAVHQPSDALQSGLKDIGGTMAEEWSEAAGPQGKEILEDFRE